MNFVKLHALMVIDNRCYLTQVREVRSISWSVLPLVSTTFLLTNIAATEFVTLVAPTMAKTANQQRNSPPEN